MIQTPGSPVASLDWHSADDAHATGGPSTGCPRCISPHILDAMNQDPNPPPEQEDERGVVLAPARTELQPPPLYRVLLLNDDYTPMDFVIEVLQLFFGMNRERATQVMLHVHTRGQGVCGVFTREVAETKVVHVNDFSRTHQHPLMCTMEQA